LGQGSTIAQIETLNKNSVVASSNFLLVTNLLDIQTGRSVRRERHVKEAQQSAIQFYRVLNDLISGGDWDALMVFLMYCDIPVIGATRPVFGRGMKPAWEGGAGMRKLGEKNLKVFQSLHEAVVGFVDRHLKKLERHVKHGGLSGISNFMHILLAVGGILRAQVERAMQGFESKKGPMSVDEWFGYRQQLDCYFNSFEKSVSNLSEEYLVAMCKNHEREEIGKLFSPDLEPFHDLCSEMLSFRERFESLRISKLKVQVTGSRVVTPNYFSSVLGETKWPAYAETLISRVERVDAALI